MPGLIKRIFDICNTAPATVAGPIRSPARHGSRDFASATGPLLVEIGNPACGSPRAETAAAVLAALSRPVCPRPISFTTDPERAAAPAIRVILSFHPSLDLSPAELARGVVRGIAPDARLTLLAVFASGAEVLASVEGRAGGVASPQDKGFAALVHQAVRELLG